MGSCLKKGVLAIVMMGLIAAAVSKPAHVLFHVGKNAAYPLKSSHSAWTFLTEVF